MKELNSTGKREKLARLGIIIMVASQILYVLSQISGYFLRAASLKDFSPASYFNVTYFLSCLSVIGICLIAAGIYKSQNNRLFFIGCAFLALHTILSLRSLLINGLDRNSLTLNSQLSLICDYLSHLALIGIIACMILFVLKKRGRIAGEIFAVIILFAKLPGIYRTLILTFSEDYGSIRIILLHNSLFTLCSILLMAGFLFWFYAHGLYPETESAYSTSHAEGKWFLIAGSFFFLLTGIAGIVLCFIGYMEGIDFLIFTFSAITLVIGLYGLANSRSHRHAKTCTVIGGIQVLNMAVSLVILLFQQDGAISLYYWTSTGISILFSLLYAVGGRKNM